MSGKIAKLALLLNDWRWKDLKRYMTAVANQYNSFNPEVYASNIFGTSKSIELCKPDCQELKDSWYYTAMVELINSVQD
jgi:hypothetical protein